MKFLLQNFFPIKFQFLSCLNAPKNSPSLWETSFTSTMIDLSWLTISTHPEQAANVTLLDLPTNFWSVLSITNFFLVYIIIILFLPLGCGLFILLTFLRNQINVFYFGTLTKFETQTLNYWIFTRNHWRLLWSYAHDIVPRHFLRSPKPETPSNYF
jgi:hypothetical protein